MGIFDFLRWSSPKLEKKIDRRRAKLGNRVVDSEMGGVVSMIEGQLKTVTDKIATLKKKDTVKPGELEDLYQEQVAIQKALREAKKPKPLEYLQKRLEKSVSRDRVRHKRQETMLREREDSGHKKQNEVPGTNDWQPKKEIALERLLETYYLMHPSRVPVSYVKRELAKPDNTKTEIEIRQQVYESQKRSLMSWVEYFKTTTGNFLFMWYVINEILHYDFYFLSRDLETGEWKNQRRKDLKDRRNYCGAFPQFEPDLSPLILGRMSEYVNLDVTENFLRGYLSNQHPKLAEAVLKKDFREMYFYIREKILEEKRILEGLEIVEGTGTWVNGGRPFTIVGLDKNKPKDLVKIKEQIRGLMQATQYSKEQCIKEYGKAFQYLEKGDVYIYTVNKKDVVGRIYPVSAVAIHTMRNGDGMETVNPNEIHGDDENQGIELQYLQIAKDFVMQKKVVDGKETEEFRFANAAELGIKFADTLIYNNVRAKIDNLGKIDPETGQPYLDLEPNELKFLYQIYRQVEGFELNGAGSLRYKVEELKQKRLRALNPVHFEQEGNVMFVTQGEKLAIAEAQKRKDIAKMFTGLVISSALGITVKATEVVDGGGPIFIVEMYPNAKEIVGPLFISRGHSVKLPIKLQKINGITLADIDRYKIENSQIKEFPEEKDPRLATVYLEN